MSADFIRASAQGKTWWGRITKGMGCLAGCRILGGLRIKHKITEGAYVLFGCQQDTVALRRQCDVEDPSAGLAPSRHAAGSSPAVGLPFPQEDLRRTGRTRRRPSSATTGATKRPCQSRGLTRSARAGDCRRWKADHATLRNPEARGPTHPPVHGAGLARQSDHDPIRPGAGRARAARLPHGLALAHPETPCTDTADPSEAASESHSSLA